MKKIDPATFNNPIDGVLNKQIDEKMTAQLSGDVFYVECADDNTVLIAMDIKISHGYIYWFDTVKERIMAFSDIKINQDSTLNFERSSKKQKALGKYTFTPMSLSIYREKVKDNLLNGETLNTQEELVASFLKTRDHAF